MLDTIILLSGATERPVLASALQVYNPHLAIRPVGSLSDLAAIESTLLRRARLIAFTTPVVVPATMLDQLAFGAYNFHPGPPHFPGWAPAHFAIYQQATEFGATVHLMTERVDEGPIVGVDLFRISEDLRICEVEAMAYTRLARLFWQFAKLLATQSEPLAELPIRWSGRKTTRRHYAEICNIPLDISKEELDRRIAVFGGNDFGVNLTINLHGTQFQAAAKDHAPTPTIVSAKLENQERAA